VNFFCGPAKQQARLNATDHRTLSGRSVRKKGLLERFFWPENRKMLEAEQIFSLRPQIAVIRFQRRSGLKSEIFPGGV
jgi:hypothetical protein